eukprot:1193448-Prorocentrum_minimum.AAC.5
MGDVSRIACLYAVRALTGYNAHTAATQLLASLPTTMYRVAASVRYCAAVLKVTGTFPNGRNKSR